MLVELMDKPRCPLKLSVQVKYNKYIKQNTMNSPPKTKNDYDFSVLWTIYKVYVK